jgi:hypothetical protein
MHSESGLKSDKSEGDGGFLKMVYIFYESTQLGLGLAHEQLTVNVLRIEMHS